MNINEFDDIFDNLGDSIDNFSENEIYFTSYLSGEKIYIIASDDIINCEKLIFNNDEKLISHETNCEFLFNLKCWTIPGDKSYLDGFKIKIIKDEKIIYENKVNINKECFLITAYSDTDKRKEIFKSILEHTKTFDIDLCIYSHYPIDFEFQKQVKYSIYNSENEILKSTWWHHNFQDTYELRYFYPSYNYAVMSQWKDGVKYLFNLGYDIVHVLNYDIFIPHEMFNLHKIISNNKSVFYNNTNLDITTQFFSIYKNDIDIIDHLSKENYLKSDLVFSENFVFEYIKYKNIVVPFPEQFKDEFLKYEIGINSDRGKSLFFDYEINDCICFGGFLEGELVFAFYDVKGDIYFNIKIDNKLFDGKIENGSEFLLNTNIKKTEISDIKVKINDVEMKESLIKKIFNNEVVKVN